MFDPYFRGDEQLLAGNARLFESIAHFLFVEVRLCRVDVAVTGFQGIRNAAFALFLCHLIHAVSELGHLYPVCKSYIFHKRDPPFDLRLYYTARFSKRESQKSLSYELKVNTKNKKSARSDTV